MLTKHSHDTNKDVDRFDRWSETYEDSWMQRWLFERVHKAVLNVVAQRGNEPGVILDVGCGTGKLLRAAGIRWPNAQLIGVDPAQGMIKVAQHLTPDATFHIGTAESLPLADYSVDLVLSTTSFHHWRDHAAGVREVARVLRPGGSFFLADFSVPAWVSHLTHHALYQQPAKQRRLFTDAGLNVEAQQPIFSHYFIVTIGTRPLIQ